MIRHLYVHIPFCVKLCPYCSFHVEMPGGNKSRRFLDALLLELEKQRDLFGLKPRTIFLGGGTPTMLSISELEYLLGGIRTRLDLSELAEWTIEINPATVSAEKARMLRGIGVTRASMGVQSWDDATLKTLGRTHSGAQAERTFAILREAGFGNINLDLMFAVPGQTPAQWRASLDKTIALAPDHVSAYCLTYEQDTEFFRKLGAGEFAQDDEGDAVMFETAMDALPAAGFAQYEISNYARPGSESLHNMACWNGDDYLGLGPSAFSTVGARRWQNVPDSAEYARRVFADEPVFSFEENLSPGTRSGEIAAFGIRTARGLPRADVEPWRAQIAELESLGLLENRGNRIVLTRRGKLLADSVAEAFV